MARFIARVELHGASWQDYDKLHAAMEAAGFSRTITGDNGVTFHLPTAEYEIFSAGTSEQVLEIVKAAANQVGKKYGAIVTKANGQSWVGLPQVVKRAR